MLFGKSTAGNPEKPTFLDQEKYMIFLLQPLAGQTSVVDPLGCREMQQNFLVFLVIFFPG